ncbi:class I SAM-dependent methyltransferase [Chitinophaga pendula]|uniref:class I SAM-dependent methyltransferase n=1 Tax=Chitinophaga TaxID=79328 RepID=UPI000BAFE304|nr:MULTISPECIES: class I SAM-dependent methyltransferase [Chitinophaga]ASZ14987.1 SAM-dependent methyltransferase [Chitinophaga sp. MD30]UCJ09819.1 class I SAM-dependent methyltransferase [Chitinophaga pendula]
MIASKEHWEHIYQTRQPDDVSWTQAVPSMSLSLIKQLNLAKDARIIDIGGGDSMLVDFLLNEGYTNLAVLDISAHSLERAKQRLGKSADLITWIEADINDFKPEHTYDLWHDRAAFHFLRDPDQQYRYVQTAAIAATSHLIIGTFSISGPTKCSGLAIQQYDEKSMEDRFAPLFRKITCSTEDHKTPAGKLQNFIFCTFERT